MKTLCCVAISVVCYLLHGNECHQSLQTEFHSHGWDARLMIHQVLALSLLFSSFLPFLSWWPLPGCFTISEGTTTWKRLCTTRTWGARSLRLCLTSSAVSLLWPTTRIPLSQSSSHPRSDCVAELLVPKVENMSGLKADNDLLRSPLSAANQHCEVNRLHECFADLRRDFFFFL